MKNKIIIAVFLVLLVAVGLFVYFGQMRQKGAEPYYSGTVEATHSELAFQVNGKVAHVAVREGQSVESGQLLAELDSDEYRARHEQAGANLDRSLKNVRELQTNLDMSRKTLPADVAKAEALQTAARLTLEDAARDQDRYHRLFQRGVVSEKEWETVKLRSDTAETKLEDARASLRQARSNLERLETMQREIEAAQAQAKALRAALEQAEIQLGYTRLSSPFKGVITSRNVEPGEVVTPTRQVLTVSDLATVDLKIFVGETEIGKVKPGQRVDVKTDTFPDRFFSGKVSFISPEGEFTPKVIQTHKERVKLVYLVKVSIPNPGFELKTGMPADAWLR